ncbi:ABC transporter substrate-binding protein [Streptomyces tubbatahanensis]|uniref:ABC transporter substrate-binding protein n=1 Tax=Streptomyces tubbatahanensis TaxID=2923272 RepID=A0ABY3XM48_9ACTN|nr:ABC transporter substrate-binding protein [Streptomyces tubbatahanensis]UNS95503.1 ABC transporter substrate-binding protein [Streptomyces tubbatahanensis]
MATIRKTSTTGKRSEGRAHAPEGQRRTGHRALRTRPLAYGLTAVLGAGLLSGCAQDSGGSSASADGKTTVSVGVFGVFGYKQAGLYDEYEKLHPNIRIKENAIERNENYYPALLNHLSAGSGLSDIQAVEVDNISEVAQLHADKFVDMAKAEGVDKSDWLSWKWNQAKAPGGQVVGLGTDIGPMGICYRKDLFEKAGLPSERGEVGKLWKGDWEKYVETGERYMKAAPKDTAFTDGAAGLYNGAVSSYPVKYYDADGKLVYKKSKGVRESWDLAMRAVDGKMTGKLKQFDKEWDQAYANGAFASVVCPPWMLGYIKEKAGEKAADKWDVAPAPKPGNWGGSFLTVPKGGKNEKEALKLAQWLTAPKQQARLFEKQASFPSAKAAYDLPEVKDAKHPYFGDAPIGDIFAEAAEGIPTIPLGPKDGVIKTTISDIGILQVEQQGKSPEEGWNAVVKKIDDVVEN